jgi:hypothetical protein
MLGRLQALDPAIGEIEQLKHIRSEVRSRMGRFVNLAPGDNSTAFFASDLTREHLREVVRLMLVFDRAARPADNRLQHAVVLGLAIEPSGDVVGQHLEIIRDDPVTLLVDPISRHRRPAHDRLVRGEP